MHRSQKLLISMGVGVLAVTAIAAVAGPVIYRDFIAAPAAESPHLGADSGLIGERSGAPLVASDLAGEWHVGEGSSAGYRVDEVLGDTDVTVTGRTTQVAGSLTVSAAGDALDAAEFTVDVASIETDSAPRDNYFRSTALRTDEFPEATFTLTSPVPFDQLPAAGEPVQLRAMGELTIAGVTQPVSAHVSVRSDGETAEIAGSVPIHFADFGVTAPQLGFVQVAPDGAVEFQLVARR